jgi:hypothetical protein
MLWFGHAANETFSPDAEGVEGAFGVTVTVGPAGAGVGNQVVGVADDGRERAMVAAAIRWGDEVVFERIDLAEALGIWRNARGRIVGIHRQDGHSATVDVAFEGHAVLERYLPDLFRWVQ